jgi:penicillin-binding protein 1C
MSNPENEANRDSEEERGEELNQNPGSQPKAEDHNDAGARLRRLLAASDEDEEPVESVETTQADEAGDDAALEAQTSDGEDGESETEADQGQVTSRHPTGTPDQTGGWFGTELPPTDPDLLSRSEADTGPIDINRHPTGAPDKTGGWYGQEEDRSQQDRPPRPQNDRTTPVPLRPRPGESRSDSRTLPPSGSPPRNRLPSRVNEVDNDATQVSPVAYGRPRASQQSPTRPVYSGQVPPARPAARRPGSGRTAAPKGEQSGWRKGFGCAMRLAVGLLFIGILTLVVASSFLVYQYFSIAAGLPDIDDLRSHASQFETTRILDREGNVLYEILDPNAGRRTYVPLERISPHVIAATIATEDKEFYNHPGFDPVAIARALFLNYSSTGDPIGGPGASTITQQLARTLLFDASERNERSVQRKAREIVLAAEITRQYSKEEILELYLNENYYGNLAYGIQAAAETYFDTSAQNLTLGQAAFLAGLPQAPAVYDIYSNRDAALQRHRAVLVLMYQLSQERDCIYVSTSIEPVCVEPVDATQAAQEIEAFNFEQDQAQMRSPHWVNFVRSLLESQYDANTIYRSGFTVYTTLDPDLQEMAQEIVTAQVATLVDRNASDGALVAIEPSTGEILAMVGSADFYNEAIAGQVNMAVSPRQPGSSIKPLTYVAAFEQGWTPSTLIWDVSSEFPPSGDPNDPREPYVPVNYDGQFHGPVLVRDALANSYNIPAVKALDFVGIYDDPETPNPDGFIKMAERLGITTLTRPDYGLSLTLGGGDVSLLELTSAYSVFANGGRRMPPVAITRIEDFEGNLVYEYNNPTGEQVLRTEHAYLISSVLSDNQARAPMFGQNSVLNLPFQVAAKTGTTNDFRDNWTLGYTPDLAVGVWVGNADYTPMVNTTGLTGAAPIWSQYMQAAIQELTGGSPSPFVRPSGIVDHVICSVSGAQPSEWCTSQKSEMFAYDQPPKPADEDLGRRVAIDTWTGLRASAFCSEFVEEEFAIDVEDPWAIRWLRESGQGQAWAEANGFPQPLFIAPERECRQEDSQPVIHFAALNEGQRITENPLDIYAVVYSDQNFRDYRLEWGEGDDPDNWHVLRDGMTNQYRQPEQIYSWDLTGVRAGRVTLRLYVNSTQGTYAERRIHLDLQVPTPTPTVTPTPTTTQTPTMTPTITATPTVTETSVPAPSNTPEPTATPE